MTAVADENKENDTQQAIADEAGGLPVPATPSLRSNQTPACDVNSLSVYRICVLYPTDWRDGDATVSTGEVEVADDEPKWYRFRVQSPDGIFAEPESVETTRKCLGAFTAFDPSGTGHLIDVFLSLPRPSSFRA